MISFNEKLSIFVADILFLTSSIIMAIVSAYFVIILGRIFVGLRVGIASITTQKGVYCEHSQLI